MKLIVKTISALLILIGLSGCSSMNEVGNMSSGLVINNYSTSLGSKESNTDITTIKYSIYITNENKNSYLIESVEPILSQEIAAKTISDDVINEVNIRIDSEDTVEVNVEILLDTKGMTKEEIVEFTKPITEFKVKLEAVIGINR